MTNENAQFYRDRVQTFHTIVSEPEKVDFVFHTILAFQKDGWRAAINHIISRSLEELIPYADAKCLIVLLKILSKNWFEVITSKFCRHVLQRTLERCQTSPFCEDPLILDFVEQFFQNIHEHLDSYIDHKHAHHLVRLYLQLATGVCLEKDSMKNTYDLDHATISHSFDEKYARTIEHLVDRYLLNSSSFGYARSELVSPFLQSLILSATIRNIGAVTQNFSKILDSIGFYSVTESKQRLPDGFVHPVLVYLSEVLISCMPGRDFAQFLSERILGSRIKHENSEDDQGSTAPALKKIIAHSVASRIFCAVVRRIKKPQDFESLMDTLNKSTYGSSKSHIFGRVLKKGQHSVLNELAKKCSQNEFSSTQSLFLKMLYESLDQPDQKRSALNEENSLIRSVTGLTKASELSAASDASGADDPLTQPVCLPGCLLAQHLFSFGTCRPKLLAASLCAQSADRLAAWSKHPMLSRVVEAAFRSEFVSSKRVMQLCSILEPHLMDLCCDKYGSRLVETMWEALDRVEDKETAKERFVTQLTKSKSMLSGNRFGHFVHRKLQLELYAQAPLVWKKRMLHSPSIAKKRPISAVHEQTAKPNVHKRGKR